MPPLGETLSSPTTYPEFLEAVLERHGRRCWIGARAVVTGPTDVTRIRATTLSLCSGPKWDAAHLLKKSWIKDTLPNGMFKTDGVWVKVPSHAGAVIPVEGDPREIERLGLDAIVFDPRWGVPGCRRHHFLLDQGRIAVLRKHLPPEVEEAAKEFGFEWALDRVYESQAGTVPTPGIQESPDEP